jgi:hypothetical protein
MTRTLFNMIVGLAVAATVTAGDVKPPVIVKKGTIDLDLCETTPFVLKDKLYRLEWHRNAKRLRIMDPAAQTEVSHFGDKHRFPCAFVEGDTVYVIGTTEDKEWCGTTLTLFTSKDLTNWNEQVAYQNTGFRMCNTSICKADGRYVMSVELAVGGFMGRFLESKDLMQWTLIPAECHVAGAGSPHLLRWHEGWFYMFSTVGGHPRGYVLLLKRSRDLKKWEPSPFNPVMMAEPEDKLIANPKLTGAQLEKIAKARDYDNSDVDFCEYNGKLVINYCWGNQVGTEFIAEAEYAGTVAQFLEGWFPSGTPAGKVRIPAISEK